MSDGIGTSSPGSMGSFPHYTYGFKVNGEVVWSFVITMDNDPLEGERFYNMLVAVSAMVDNLIERWLPARYADAPGALRHARLQARKAGYRLSDLAADRDQIDPYVSVEVKVIPRDGNNVATPETIEIFVHDQLAELSMAGA